VLQRVVRRIDKHLPRHGLLEGLDPNAELEDPEDQLAALLVWRFQMDMPTQIEPIRKAQGLPRARVWRFVRNAGSGRWLRSRALHSVELGLIAAELRRALR
jgi:hypothetical protein